MSYNVSDDCFASRPNEPVRFIDIVPSADDESTTCCREFSSASELESYLGDVDAQNYKCRLISICQRTSWRPLQITKEMLELIVSKHDMDAAFWDLPSCFYDRNMDVEETFCVPITYSQDGPSTEILYTIRYPEFKARDNEWTRRQTGLYHRFNAETGQSLVVLFNPTSKSALHEKLESFLIRQPSRAAQGGMFWIHEMLFSTYYPAWRHYTAFLESGFLPLAGRTFATYIDEHLRVGYDNLSAIVSLGNKFLQIPTVLSRGIEVLDALVLIAREHDQIVGGARSTVISLENHRRRAAAYSRTAEYLQQRAQTTGQLLSDTLSFRDQVITKEQNGNMLRLNKSAVFITILTLIYLPASFVATFFGMNFFDMDTDEMTIVATPMIWIYVIASLALTAVTFISYWWLLQNDGPLLRSMAPKIRFVDWKGLSRKLTLRSAKVEHGEELKTLSV